MRESIMHFGFVLWVIVRRRIWCLVHGSPVSSKDIFWCLVHDIYEDMYNKHY